MRYYATALLSNWFGLSVKYNWAHKSNTLQHNGILYLSQKQPKKSTYASVMLVLGSRDTSMTVVPSMSTSLQAVVLRPVTLQAW